MKQFKLIPLAVLASLTMSSCSDLLEKDSEDTVTIDQYLTSDANLLSFTYHIYGPYTWTNYDSKFSWCANELTVGNVYHNFGDEGSFFFLQFSETNAHLLNGYQCLYGVISRCNMIINDLDKQCGSGVSAEAKKRAKGEAYLMRGYCYFLLTEYWGEVPIITNNNKTILADKSNDIKKASRRCVYAQAERDFKKAEEMLPANRWGTSNERPAKVAAKGMLAKLYLTMGAAAATPDLANHKFNAEKSFNEYNQDAIKILDEIIPSCYLESTANYENIFWPKSYNQENLFSLYFEQGPYGAGSQRQIMWGRSKFMNSGENAYGGEKGLTVTLFNSFEPSDIRKKACSYYADGDKMDDAKEHTPVYKMYSGPDYVYYYNPSKTLVDKKGLCNSPYGSEPEMPCKNALRKFVYRMPVTNEFSAALSLPILRTADLYLMRAEAKMALETGAPDVFAKSSAGLEDLNVVRQRAGLTAYNQPVALYDTDAEQTTTFVDDRDASDVKEYSYKTYSNKYDLFEERRHEFALECQNWLDLKRIYYRNQASALEFLEHQDRGWVYGNKLGVEVAKGDAQYQRQYELNTADPTLPAETPIDTKNVAWFFPVPSAVASSLSSKTFDDLDQIKKGSYPY
ncbi:MAG: RagB/SusD family nutrient uptake outer membrane protein [Paludibacteraceae bacterium]|nr:RagB/SusD family nutrient uptake outer membrane protein [Paludibacteraceae bacterium]